MTNEVCKIARDECAKYVYYIFGVYLFVVLGSDDKNIRHEDIK